VTSRGGEPLDTIMSLTWILGILLGAALLFALYAGNARRKP
jgi:hypothetical protein